LTFFLLARSDKQKKDQYPQKHSFERQQNKKNVEMKESRTKTKETVEIVNRKAVDPKKHFGVTLSTSARFSKRRKIHESK
jgi:hypothetical protein